MTLEILKTTRLTIRDQNGLLNQISATYPDFYRASMEYVDNAVDAAEMMRRSGSSYMPRLQIHINTKAKTVTFKDNCGGMSPDELCGLLNKVGLSGKRRISWVNGQFGFGVHSFRAFARYALFTSYKTGHPEATVKIDRTYDEKKKIICYIEAEKLLEEPGTCVTIAKFDPYVFRKDRVAKRLIEQIEIHFDDVLRAGLISIAVSEDAQEAYLCRCFDFHSLPGLPYSIELPCKGSEREHTIKVDLKVLNRPEPERPAQLTNKKRRVQPIGSLQTFKSYLRSQGLTSNIWTSTFLVGNIEIDDFVSPHLSRNDLKDSPYRDVLYQHLVEVQGELEKILNQQLQESLNLESKEVGEKLSNILSRVLRRFKVGYERVVPTSEAGMHQGRTIEEVDGLGIPEEFSNSETGEQEEVNKPDEEEVVKHTIEETKEPDEDHTLPESPIDESDNSKGVIRNLGPKIEFQKHRGGDRVIDAGDTLIINTNHPDFFSRCSLNGGKIRFDDRLISYIAMSIAPFCVRKIVEKEGEDSVTHLSLGALIVTFAIELEQVLTRNIKGEEIELGEMQQVMV